MIEGAQFRQQQITRAAVVAGWTAARLSKAKRIPTLQQLFGDRRRPQTPAEQAPILHAWAAAAKAQGLAVRVGRLDEPFQPFDVEPREVKRGGHA